ncbi:SurA N-terminal domain-containing protein [Alkalilimnicola ehrlichii MLHE-1]|uniref:PpiC domain-containing protein n=1 Tax=Alkalilimnicola ehrlichii (strain ATCC BAA-1101 / DSM 17681 / MLHE-1) TaxID=187272 RepID=Q0A6B1_ALKEH|nr:SurA N-terminal domain-containing protein [Alkalilimnicola ehrlichii]ABI57626.1 hypothetical protein Mlg_2284 [Alkalilimnicola ehrlichii MLHE-1]
MLEAIRSAVKGWVAWAVVIVISLPFIVVGGYSYFAGDDGRVVAEVEGVEITREQVAERARQQQRQLEEFFGDLGAAGVDESTLRREARDGLIEEALLHVLVTDGNLRVGDRAVAQRIRQQDIFHQGGTFSMERYQQLLSANRLTPDQYEEMVRRDLLVEQFQRAVTGSALVRDWDTARLAALDRQQRDIHYLVVSADEAPDAVSDAAVQAHYEENAERYTAPRQVRLEYIELHQDELAPDDSTRFFELTEDAANVAYEDPDSLQSAADLLGVELSYSDWVPEDGSAEGLWGRPEVVEAAFSDDVLEFGYNSELIELGSGHALLLRVDDVREAEPLGLDEVADEIRRELAREQGRLQARNLGELLEREIAAGAEMAELAEREGLEVRSAEGLDRGTLSDAVPTQVVDRAFRLPRPVDGQPSVGGTSVQGGDYAVVQVVAVTDGDTDLGDEEREHWRADLRQVFSQSEWQALMAGLREEMDVKLRD